MERLNLLVPAGVGDIAWIWKKLYSVRDSVRLLIAAEEPARSFQFCRAAGMTARYSPHTFTDILVGKHAMGWGPSTAQSWGEIEERARLRATTPIECNKWLEVGNRIESWLPDLPTEHHFPINPAPAASKQVAGWLGALPDSTGPILLVSCASYRGAHSWGAWELEEWATVLRHVQMDAGWQPLLVGGVWDDLTKEVAAATGLPSLVGQTDFDHIVALMKHRDVGGFLGFASGLMVAADILRLPSFGLYAHVEGGVDHRRLATSWPSPSHYHEWATWRSSPAEAWPTIESWLKRSEHTFFTAFEPPPASGTTPSAVVKTAYVKDTPQER